MATGAVARIARPQRDIALGLVFHQAGRQPRGEEV